jgi:hypothetical protein
LLIHAKRGGFETFLRDVVRTITTARALILIASGLVLVPTTAPTSAPAASVVASARSSPTADLLRDLLRGDNRCRSSRASSSRRRRRRRRRVRDGIFVTVVGVFIFFLFRGLI